MADSLITIDNTSDTTIYGKGDTCLLINPFDTYHMFTVYNDWNSDSKTPMNLSNGNQKIYLVFKSSSKEVRIEEFENGDSTYSVDRSNGEVLFKISKENATSILALTTDTFYLTRKIEETDSNGDVLYSSGEEVMYIGKWADESKWTSSSLSATIKSLQQQLNTANAQITSLNSQVSQYKTANASLTSANETLQSQVDTLQSQVDNLQEQVDKYESANEFTSVVISDNATYTYYNEDQQVDENGKPILTGTASTTDIISGLSTSTDFESLVKKVTENQLSEFAKNLQKI